MMFLVLRAFAAGWESPTLEGMEDALKKPNVADVDASKIVGFLNVIGGVFNKMGFKVGRWAGAMGEVLLSLLEYCEVEDGGDSS